MVQSIENKKTTLHSRYNPQAEAEKYINSITFRNDPRFFIFIEPGRGFMLPIVHKKFPFSKIIVLHVEEQETIETEIQTPEWILEKSLEKSLEKFLEKEIPDTKAEFIQIIEWRPALSIYGERYLKIFSETVNFIKRIDANKRTISAFGESWFKNFFKIISTTRNVLQLDESFNTPCIVTGAGPSLEETIPIIKELKSKSPVFILAVSAAVNALLEKEISPDLIISTDGGNWALFHLYECLRKSNTTHFALSLYASVPSQIENTALLLISDGSFWQNLILQHLDLPFINLMQRGTVTAQAIDLAFVLTKGNVCISGLDLANRDIQTHVRPYSLNKPLEEKSSRLNPYYTQIFSRSANITSGGSHNIYAEWFRSNLHTYPKRLYSLGNNHTVFAEYGIENCPPILKCKKARHKLNVLQIKPKHNVAKQGVEILRTALQNPKTESHIRKELVPLLFPNEDVENINSGILYEKIYSIVNGIQYG